MDLIFEQFLDWNCVHKIIDNDASYIIAHRDVARRYEYHDEKAEIPTIFFFF